MNYSSSYSFSDSVQAETRTIRRTSRTISSGRFFYLTILIFVALAPLIRELGGLLYYFIVVASIVTVIFRRAWISNKPLLIFIATGVLYVIGSYLDVFPRSWTQHYTKTAIPQQASFVFTIYFFITAGRVFWLDILNSPRMKRRLVWLMVAGFWGPAVLGIAMGHFDVQTAFGFFFRSLSNPAMMAYLGLGLFVFYCMEKRQVLIALVLTPFMAVFTPFLQNTIVALVFLGLAFSPKPCFSLVIVLAVYLLLWLVSFNFIQWLSFTDPHLGLRLWLQLDAFEAIRDTFGLGVGFGSEAVKISTFFSDLFYLSRQDPFGADKGFLFISNHNSFIGMFFRLGLIGGGTFLWFFFVSLFPKCSDIKGLAKVESFSFFILFLVIFSNPAIESPTYHVGVGYAMGLLIALHEFKRVLNEDLPSS